MAGPDVAAQRERSRVLVGGPGVDTASAQEFQQEILRRTTVAELTAIAGDLERKSQALRQLLDGGAAGLGRAGLGQVLRWTFATRRRAGAILDAAGPERLGAAIGDLLSGEGPVAERFDRFGAVTAGLPVASPDLASELLHFTRPQDYWLWTRWMWDSATETGALALVTTEDAGLSDASTAGAAYLAVGRATALVDETGKAAGFTAAGPGLFGTDVFLAAVYGVYMFTVLRMRMTQEFTRLVPPLPSLIRRLLGVYHLEE